jgi:hypothetical protein
MDDFEANFDFTYYLMKDFEKYLTYEMHDKYAYLTSGLELVGTGCEVISILEINHDTKFVGDYKSYFDEFDLKGLDLYTKAIFKKNYSNENHLLQWYFENLSRVLNMESQKFETERKASSIGFKRIEEENSQLMQTGDREDQPKEFKLELSNHGDVNEEGQSIRKVSLKGETGSEKGNISYRTENKDDSEIVRRKESLLSQKSLNSSKISQKDIGDRPVSGKLNISHYSNKGGVVSSSDQHGSGGVKSEVSERKESHYTQGGETDQKEISRHSSKKGSISSHKEIIDQRRVSKENVIFKETSSDNREMSKKASITSDNKGFSSEQSKEESYIRNTEFKDDSEQLIRAKPNLKLKLGGGESENSQY